MAAHRSKEGVWEFLTLISIGESDEEGRDGRRKFALKKVHADRDCYAFCIKIINK